MKSDDRAVQQVEMRALTVIIVLADSTPTPTATVSIGATGAVDLMALLGKSSTEALLKMCEDSAAASSASSPKDEGETPAV